MTPKRESKPRLLLLPFDRDHTPPVRELCALHAALFPQSPLARLGPRFMKYYYRRLPRLGAISGAVVYVNDQAAGFITVTADPDHFMTTVLRRDIGRLAGALLLTLARTPKRLGPVLEAWRMMRRRSDESPDGEKVGEILSFGILPEYREAPYSAQTGASIVHELYDWALAELGRHTLARIRVSVDKADLSAQIFYNAQGWRMARWDEPGQRTPSMEMVLTPQPPGEPDSARCESPGKKPPAQPVPTGALDMQRAAG